MILAALNELYYRLLDDDSIDVAQPGFCQSNAGVALEISCEGELIRAIPLGSQKGKRYVPLNVKVPDRVKRSRGDAANFLCDNAEYMLGVSLEDSEQRALRRHKVAKKLHEEVLGSCHDKGSRAVIQFLSKWRPERYETDPALAGVKDMLSEGHNIVFRLEGDTGFIHDRPSVANAWAEYLRRKQSDAKNGQCLVTGESGPVAQLHKSISRISGAQSTGASLVSFNFAASESYGKKQGQNSPVGERAAFAYGTALNWLTNNPRHRVVMGDTTVLFWAERSGPEENLILDLFPAAVGMGQSESQEEAREAANDEKASSEIGSVLDRIMKGRPVDPTAGGLDSGVRFYILGLAPNAARLSVRFWHVDTFGQLLERLRVHFDDVAMVHREGERPATIGRVLHEIAPAVSKKSESVPATLIGSLWRAVLEGTMYPQSLYSAILARIRADFNDPNQPSHERKITYPRVAYLKAHLKRKARITGQRDLEEELTEMLNPQNKNAGYLLGRLFALLEKAQQDANPGIKATIKDRYYASASSTPAPVFPVLIRLAQHHLEKSEYGHRVDKLIEEVIADLGSFPTHLTLDQQGLFAIGYYHQRNALFQKSSNSEKGGSSHE